MVTVAIVDDPREDGFCGAFLAAGGERTSRDGRAGVMGRSTAMKPEESQLPVGGGGGRSGFPRDLARYRSAGELASAPPRSEACEGLRGEKKNATFFPPARYLSSFILVCSAGLLLLSPLVAH